MMVLKMEPDEITTMYRDAKNKFKQVRILAEMNCVSNKEMAQWLEAHGYKVDTRYFPERRMKKKETPDQEIEVAVMYEDGTVERHFDQTAKADAGKPRLSLVPMRILWAIAEVREYGTNKYKDPDNWKRVEPERYKEALLRHILRYIDDPDGVDDESGLPHLWHAATNIAFLIALAEKGGK